MSAAEGVTSLLIQTVGRPPVVDRGVNKAGQHTGGVDPVAAALGVHRAERQPIGRRAVDPRQSARDPSARLIEMRYLGVLKLAADLLQEPLQPVGALGHEPLQRPHRDRRARPVWAAVRSALDSPTSVHQLQLCTCLRGKCVQFRL